LGLVDDSRAVLYLIEVVGRDSSEKVRVEAIASLAEYRSPEILDCLIAEVHREKRSRRPRQEVAKQLRNYDTDEAVEALTDLLQDDDAFVRDHAAESLLQLNRPRLREIWERALKDRSPHVQKAAMKALTNWGHQFDSKYRSA
jgi:HEAT repeat protein